jgi:hypothetical protein
MTQQTIDKLRDALRGATFIAKTLGYLEVVPQYGDGTSRMKQCDKAIEELNKLRLVTQAALKFIETDEAGNRLLQMIEGGE